MLFYTIRCPESLPSQIVHRPTTSLKLGCGTSWMTLRFNIVVLYRSIYILSTGSGQQKSLRRRLFRLVWVTRHSCPGDHAAKAKVSSLDAFAFNRVAWFTVIAYCVAVRISSPCRNLVIPTQAYLAIHLGGDAGNRTRVHSAFIWKDVQQFLKLYYNNIYWSI